MFKIYIGLGANLGQRFLTLKSAFEALKNIPATANWKISKIYETPPEHDEGPEFLNAVAVGWTTLKPQRLLEYLLSLEKEFGRRKHSDRSRELDLDLIDYNYEVSKLTEPDLILPHPRMHQRWFVLKPMNDLDPEWEHPELHKTVQALLAEVQADGREFDGNIE